MFKYFVLTIIFFEIVVFSKEITTSELKPNTILIKVTHTQTLEQANKFVKKFETHYDTLTLKDKNYIHYIANIEPIAYKEIFNDIKKIYPDAFKSNKKTFETTGVIIGNTSDILNIKALEDTTLEAPQKLSTLSSEDLNSSLLSAEQNTTHDSDGLENFLKTSNVAQEASKVKDSNQTQPFNSNEIKVDLIDAVLQALSISHKIMASREKMLQAKYNIDIAYGDYHPSINASYTVVKTEKRPGDMTPTQTYEKAKYYGDEKYSLTLSQNIYAGGETENEIERLKAQYLISKTDYERLLEDEIFKAITSYIDVVFTRDALNINKKNIEELEIIFQIVKAKFDAGALSIGELSSIEASVANAKSQLSRTTSKFSNAMEYFKFITGEAFADTYPYEKIVHVSVKPLKELLEYTKTTNTTLKIFNYEILSKKFNIAKLKAPFRPKVDLVLAKEKITDKENFEMVEDSYLAKLMVSYNLYNGGKDKNEYLKAFSSLQERIFEKEAELRKIKWELEKLHTSLTSLQDNLSNVEKEVSSSRNMVGSYWESFRNGEQDLHVLLQGQRQLNTAELDFIQSQQDSMKDFFEILKISGDLLSYFQIDISDENFLDIAKAKYRAHYKPASSSTLSLQDSPIQRSDLNATQNPSDVLKKDSNDSTLSKLLSFHERFLMENPDRFTLVMTGTNTPLEGLKRIADLHIEDESFIYEHLENQKIKTKIVYGIYDSPQDANLSFFKKTKGKNNNLFTVEKIGNVQKEFKDFSELLLVDVNDIPKPILPQVIEVEKKEEPFITNREFKDKFLTAPKNYFTINITTLSEMDKAGKLVKEAMIETESFVFTFGKSHNWVKIMYGVFPSYEAAKNALDNLGAVKTIYMPVIEPINLKQELYQRFNQP
ncbi:MAG: TolC family protein [Epsilonproteobacteria bacterium]|nr:TolC family protein [Campylobacterota bacterium]